MWQWNCRKCEEKKNCGNGIAEIGDFFFGNCGNGITEIDEIFFLDNCGIAENGEENNGMELWQCHCRNR